MLWFVAALIAMTLAVSAIAAVKLCAMTRAVAHCGEWTPVGGTVVATSIRDVLAHDMIQYAPIVEYRYVVGDTQYASEALSIGVHALYSSRRGAERRLARYKAGQVVQVQVDPSNPARSVLECREPFIPVLWTMLVAAWIALLVGLGVMLMPGVDGPEPMLRLEIGFAPASDLGLGLHSRRSGGNRGTCGHLPDIDGAPRKLYPSGAPRPIPYTNG
jgi:hypothetical protein